MDEGIGLQLHHALLLALDWVLDPRVPWRRVAQFVQDPEAVVDGLLHLLRELHIEGRSRLSCALPSFEGGAVSTAASTLRFAFDPERPSHAWPVTSGFEGPLRVGPRCKSIKDTEPSIPSTGNPEHVLQSLSRSVDGAVPQNLGYSLTGKHIRIPRRTGLAPP